MNTVREVNNAAVLWGIAIAILAIIFVAMHNIFGLWLMILEIPAIYALARVDNIINKVRNKKTEKLPFTWGLWW
jgi:hypothetical protein